MRGGRLRHRVTFQRRSESLNAFREQLTTYTDIAEVWAAVEPIAGKEFFAASQVQSDISTRIVCRHSSLISGVTTKDRIQFGDRYFDIRSVIDVNSRHREVQFMCTDHSIQ